MISYNKKENTELLSSNCEKCFGLCCVSLPFAKSIDFAFNKDSHIPCKNMESDFRCSIHQKLRENGFRGCTVYDCFGAGQKVSQDIFYGQDWKNNLELSIEMFSVFPIIQQIYEMLYYIDEAMNLEISETKLPELNDLFNKLYDLTNLEPKLILSLDLSETRTKVNELLNSISNSYRKELDIQHKSSLIVNKVINKKAHFAAKLANADLRGIDLSGTLLIAADLTNADLRLIDMKGADLRDANLNGANLLGSIFLTQIQVNSANGNYYTKLPSHLHIPRHWVNE